MLQAVALVIVSPLVRFFMLTELHDKPQYEKFAGMKSFPIETMHPEEGQDEAIERLLREEVGGFSILSRPYRIGEVNMCFSTGETSKVFCFTALSPDEFCGNPADTDICPAGWLTESEIISLKDGGRREVIPILQLFLASLEGERY